MDLLDRYLSLQKEIYDYFGYVEDWVVIPIDDRREFYWSTIGDERSGSVKYAVTEDELEEELGDYYQDEIYTQRFLPKWVYRALEFTMICVDPQSDGNRFLAIYDNSKERR
jgi:hypothetical protein